uniref:Uncharacterized protein n=1 Tax=Arundo donax TaxID=35708 RepID=A0A0A8YUJ3_ARUDO
MNHIPLFCNILFLGMLINKFQQKRSKEKR